MRGILPNQCPPFSLLRSPHCSVRFFLLWFLPAFVLLSPAFFFLPHYFLSSFFAFSLLSSSQLLLSSFCPISARRRSQRAELKLKQSTMDSLINQQAALQAQNTAAALPKTPCSLSDSSETGESDCKRYESLFTGEFEETAQEKWINENPGEPMDKYLSWSLEARSHR